MAREKVTLTDCIAAVVMFLAAPIIVGGACGITAALFWIGFKPVFNAVAGIAGM